MRCSSFDNAPKPLISKMYNLESPNYEHKKTLQFAHFVLKQNRRLKFGSCGLLDGKIVTSI
ncbi:hypothetical protein COT49_01490 [candidate division WWE3 bacterium CG08_land_8_20_14_0_20_40_13]|uniref:Uncharacterized protein n=1 Tax=candidate division WWE3 bacterium CG08_land_8_20_14_0_20_40_13 TaxID=1975084 RepID=A0A2H0XE34_UNCKA|nr:MAG: hypothetical protein COT49_01490 [candidate division WWE3 bacterium CG08_land_8_20_14_0_20_40_13]